MFPEICIYVNLLKLIGCGVFEETYNCCKNVHRNDFFLQTKICEPKSHMDLINDRSYIGLVLGHSIRNSLELSVTKLAPGNL